MSMVVAFQGVSAKPRTSSLADGSGLLAIGAISDPLELAADAMPRDGAAHRPATEVGRRVAAPIYRGVNR